MDSLSVLIVGSGPGGMAAALAAAARGWSITLIDDLPIGGTCLNRGCIPSKFLLARSKQLYDARQLGSSGIDVRLENLRLPDLWQQKDVVLATLRQRLHQAAKAARLRWLQGHAYFISPHEMRLTSSEETFQADRVILATGSLPIMPSTFPTHPSICNSTTIFELDRLPEHLVVLGGGYIGCELACAFHGLGARVTLIEKEARLLATQPEFAGAASVITRSFEKRGLSVWLNTLLQNIEPLANQRLRLTCSDRRTLEADTLLLALGRMPNFQGLHLENAGLVLEKGRLAVDANGRTAVPHIYALGDLVSPLPLAHTAAAEAERTLAHLAGEIETLDYTKIPRCIYTWPEAAAIGQTEDEARAAGRHPRLDRYHFAASAKALAENETEGYWLVVSDADSGEVLGAQVVGAHATELIHLFVPVLETRMTLATIARTVFAHPTLSEGLHELAQRVVARGPRTVDA